MGIMEKIERVDRLLGEAATKKEDFPRGFLIGRATVVLDMLAKEAASLEETAEEMAVELAAMKISRDDDRLSEGMEEDSEPKLTSALLFATAAVQSWFSKHNPSPVVLPGLQGSRDQFGAPYETMSSGGLKLEGEAIPDGGWYETEEEAAVALKYSVRSRFSEIWSQIVFVRNQPTIIKGEGEYSGKFAASVRLSFSSTRTTLANAAYVYDEGRTDPLFFEEGA